MDALPTGIVTFLFTDIEGSTRLLEAEQEAYRRGLARHDAIIRQAVAAHGGVVVQNRGDGFCAAFASPAEATRAALDAQRALQHEPWPTSAPMKARMGLHTGDVDLQNGEYFGAPLHRCARLMDSAHGGQALLSAATAILVGDALPPGVGLKDLGEHRLRDLAQPEHLYQLVADDLPAEFPPPRTLTAAPNNLPPHSTAFIGREQQLHAVRSALVQTDVRLVTLTGPGGTGKTRLSLQIAAGLLDSFRDGVFFVPLASVMDPDLVPSAIAQVLDVREVPGRSMAASIADALRQKRVLLVLDNFEQIADAARHVAELLAVVSGLKILVTSRAALRLYGEREHPVPPLALPDRRIAPSAANLTQFESVHLFVDRAQATRPDFAIDDEIAGDVAEICHRLDGLPLAIELAAARTRALTPRAMLQRMERRLPLLTGGARDLPARQRTLRDAIAWSYDLLEPDEQALFRRLAVFRGCTLETAETVCAGAPPRPGTTSVALPPLGFDILDGVESLVEKSLLRQDQTPDHQSWYVMLETIHEFALERLEESGESDAVHRRHALAALNLAEAAERELGGPGEATWLLRLEREHDNLRRALWWCTDRGHAEPALRLAVALWWFWGVHGHLREGRETLASLLRRFPIRPSSPRARLYARALSGAGALATMQGDHAAARALQAQSLELWRAVGDRAGVMTVLAFLGQVSSLQGDQPTALRYLEEGLSIAQELGDDASESWLIYHLGTVSGALGDWTAARAYFEENGVRNSNVDIYQNIQSHSHPMALVALEQGAFDEARTRAFEALAVYRERGDRRLEGLVLDTLGIISLASGDHVAARDHLRQSIVIHHDLGDLATVAMVLGRFVELAAAHGRWAGAFRIAGSAESLRERAGISLAPSGRARLDDVLAPGRRTLTDDVIARAWQAGRVLEPEQAIAEALAVTDPVARPRDTERGPLTDLSG